MSESNLNDPVASGAGLLASIVESSDDAIISSSLDGTVTSWNPAAEMLYGFKAKDIVGKSISLIIPAAKKQEIAFILDRIGRGERVARFETDRVRSNGSTIPVSVTIAPILDPSGTVVGAASVTHDISGRRLADERLRAAALYARSLLEASLDPLVTISTKGKITDVNEATVQVTGVAREALVGTDFSDYFTEPAGARAGYQQVFAEGSVTDYPLTIRSRDGHLTHVLYNASVYRNPHGEVLGVFAAARDVTAQHEAEEQIRTLNRDLEQRVKQRTAELEASNRELDAFSYSVSHDLRAPLRAMAGFGTLLREKEGSLLSAESLDYIRRIEANTAKMTTLIDELLRFSRLGRAAMEITVVDPTAVAAAALEDFQQEAHDAGVEVVISSLPSCRADAALLQQVFANLISNGIKFSRGRPGARVRVAAHRENGDTVYDVSDNGVGFDMKYADKLFGIFQRLHSQSDYEGTGVGLALVQRVVHRHGGRVWAEAEVGKGATFHFTLKGD